MDASLQLVRALRELGLISKEIADSIPESAHFQPIRLLARRGVLDETDTTVAIAERIGVPYLDLVDPEQTQRFTIDKFAALIDPEFCWQRRLIPLYEEHRALVTAFANPFDLDAVRFLEFDTGRSVRIVMAEEVKICHLLTQYFPNPMISSDSAADSEFTRSLEVLPNTADYEDLDIDDVEAPPIVKLTTRIIGDAYAEDASDIHIEPTQEALAVRFRIDGVLHSIFEIPRRIQSTVLSRFKLLSGMDIAEHRRPQDGRMRVKIAEDEVDLRVSTVPTAYGEKIVMRLLKSHFELLSFAKLGLPQEVETRFLRALEGRGRMILVTGPTGSGKTTTLYTALQHVTDGTTNIETVEDPIEYRIPGTNQIQINEVADITFANALRSILRQDPDVIMIGEIRDPETADIALQSAQTGHLVLSTLHTNDAPSSVTRLLNLGMDSFVLSTSLAGILAQRLVRRICRHCKERMSEERFHESRLLAERYGLKREDLHYGKGCTRCRFTGYSGRVGIFSYFDVVDEIADLIYAKAPITECIEVARQHGYRDLDQSAIELVRTGATTLAEIRPYLGGKIRAHAENTRQSAHQQLLPQVKYSEGAHDDSASQRPLILVAERDRSFRREHALLLRSQEMEVMEFDDSEKLLEYALEHRPDMILFELDMPPLGGREFLMELQDRKLVEKVPVIILSDNDSDEDEIDLLSLGADDFVQSSHSPAVILLRVQNLLKRYQHERE